MTVDMVAMSRRVSNTGRWGLDDEIGTLNYVEPSHMVRAARLVRAGRSISLAWELQRGGGTSTPSVVHRMLFQSYRPTGAVDSLEIAPHGLGITHIDALGHGWFEGVMYNGRNAAEVVSDSGLLFGHLNALRQGIVTRGVLLDVAAARGVPALRPGDIVTPADLDAAEQRIGISLGQGDALLLRTGIGTQSDNDRLSTVHRTGLSLDCLPWIHERRIAVYAGDCVDALPSSHPDTFMPLHTIGLASMGLIFVDALALEPLVALAAELGRSEFLFVCAPLPLPGGTGCAVNPLAVF
jgi:kynurenine formamidase